MKLCVGQKKEENEKKRNASHFALLLIMFKTFEKERNLYKRGGINN
jgi:hypothetical protein